MTSTWPILIALLGLVIYLIAVRPTRAAAGEVGRIMFMVGLFWVVYALLGKVLRLG